MRRRYVDPEPSQQYEPPWQEKMLNEATDVLRSVWKLHSELIVGGDFGSAGIGRRFYCGGCRSEWPCQTAKLVMGWGQIDPPSDYEPLSLSPSRQPVTATEQETG